MDEWFTADDLDVEELDADPLPVDPALHVPTDDSEWAGAPQTFEGSFSFDIGVGDSDLASLIDEQVGAELQRIEYAIRGAILAGYDGVDCHRQPTHATVDDIVPWEGEPPEPPRGVETERYCWPWFDEDELAEIARTGEVPPTLRATDDS